MRNLNTTFLLWPLMSALLMSALCAEDVAAQIYNCDNKWTNKPCSADASPRLDETAVKAPDPAQQVRSQKQSLVHELEMKALTAKRDFDVRADISSVKFICQSDSATLQDCSAEVNRMDKSISEQTSDARMARAQEDANAIEAEKLRRQRENEKAPETQINIIDNRDIIVEPRGRRRHDNGGLHGHSHGTISGSSAHIEVQGGNVSGGFSTSAVETQTKETEANSHYDERPVTVPSNSRNSGPLNSIGAPAPDAPPLR